MKTTGDRIKYYRNLNRLTMEELAQKLGTSKQNIYKYENNIITNVPYDKVLVLAKIFNIAPWDLLGWSAPQKSDDKFTQHELDIIKAYRNHPELQHAVDVLLELA